MIIEERRNVEPDITQIIGSRALGTPSQATQGLTRRTALGWLLSATSKPQIRSLYHVRDMRPTRPVGPI